MPRRRYSGEPGIADTDYVVVSISLYGAELRALDGEVARRKAAGDRKACRSRTIATAVAEMFARRDDDDAAGPDSEAIATALDDVEHEDLLDVQVAG